MSDIQGATDEGLPPIENMEIGGEGAINPRDAANALSQNRYKRDAREERAETPPAKPEIPVKETAAPATDTGEQPTETIEQQPETATPLELPRSWSKDQSERWASLPPETQEYLLEQDSKATKAVRQAQNEAAESRKAIDGERTAMEQARTQYEQALPMLMQSLQQQHLAEFADVKTPQDVERLAREDWPRYALYDAKQKQLQAVHTEWQQAQQRQQQEYRSQWDKFANDEDKKFLEQAPEMTDTTRASKVRDGSLSMLKDIGFTDQDLSKVWNGEATLSFRDHRLQLLIRDAYRYREAQSAARTKAVKPVPTVQRPGSPAARAPETDIRIQQLDKQFEKTTSWKDAAALLMERRAQRR